MSEAAGPKILIVGAGLGGLTAAAALIQAGFNVVVLEQAKELGEVGAGLHVSPNAIRVFRALGLESGLIDIANEPAAFTGYDSGSGRLLYTTPIDTFFQSRYGTSYYTVYRPDLHALLRTAIPKERIVTDARVVAVEQDADTAFAKLADGRTMRGHVVVGADGIHSVVRHAVGALDQPRFTGMMAYRGLVPAEKIPPGLIGNDAANWLGPHGHIVHYYVRRRELLNLTAIHRNDYWKEESWSIPATHAEVLETFSGWHPTIRTLLGMTTRPFKWALYDREPIQQWTRARATLLGDSVHAMLPFLAQGAAMAIEDAWVLARCLTRNRDNPVLALLEYQDERRERAAQVQLASRARAASLHEAVRWKRAVRNLQFAARSWWNPQQTMHRGEWLYGYDYKR